MFHEAKILRGENGRFLSFLFRNFFHSSLFVHTHVLVISPYIHTIMTLYSRSMYSVALLSTLTCLINAFLCDGFSVVSGPAFHAASSSLSAATMTRFDRLKKNYKGPKLNIGE